MGFSVSGSAAILFIAAFVCVGILYSAAYNGYERVQDADASYDDRMLEQRNTAVNIMNATYNASGGGYVRVNVTNAGATSLSVNHTNLLIDGELRSRDSYDGWDIEGQKNTSLWLPGETYNVTISVNDQPGSVKFVTPLGVTETESVRVF